MGADLVILSGGKGIRGPQNTGLLVGRADLVRAAAANGSPNSAIGRPCKVSKEAIVGLVAALELFLQDDHDAEWARHLDEARRILGAAAGIAGVRARLEDDRSVSTVPDPAPLDRPRGHGSHARAVMGALRRGDPPIMVRVHRASSWWTPTACGATRRLVARRLRRSCSGRRPGPDDGRWTLATLPTPDRRRMRIDFRKLVDAWQAGTLSRRAFLERAAALGVGAAAAALLEGRSARPAAAQTTQKRELVIAQAGDISKLDPHFSSSSRTSRHLQLV